MNNTMIIKVGSSISSDGFSIEIPGKLTQKYNYGYNASFNRVFENKDKPYVSDIIYSFMIRYNIDPEDIHVTSGKNVFNGSIASAENVENFVNKYLSEVFKKFNN